MVHGRACSSRSPKSAVSPYLQPWHRLTHRRERSVPEQRVRRAAIVERERAVARFGRGPTGTHRRQRLARANRRGAPAAHHMHVLHGSFHGRRTSRRCNSERRARRAVRSATELCSVSWRTIGTVRRLACEAVLASYSIANIRPYTKSIRRARARRGYGSAFARCSVPSARARSAAAALARERWVSCSARRCSS